MSNMKHNDSSTDFFNAVHFRVVLKKAYEENKERIFEAIMSAEVIDHQGDLVPIEALQNVMDIYLKRGAPIFDMHRSIHVGKVLEYKIIRLDDGTPAIWIKGQIFNDYTIDDEVWRRIKDEEYTGVSIGGFALQTQRKCDDNNTCYNVIPKLELLEVSVVDKPANPQALIIAKQKDVTKDCKDQYVQENGRFKPDAGGSRFNTCVRWAQNCEGLSEQDAQELCAEIGRRAGRIKSVEGEEPITEIEMAIQMAKEKKKSANKKEKEDCVNCPDVKKDEGQPAPKEVEKQELDLSTLQAVLVQISEKLTDIDSRLTALESKEAMQNEEEQPQEEKQPPPPPPQEEEEQNMPQKAETIVPEEIIVNAVEKILDQKFKKIVSTPKPKVEKTAKEPQTTNDLKSSPFMLLPSPEEIRALAKQGDWDSLDARVQKFLDVLQETRLKQYGVI